MYCLRRLERAARVVRACMCVSVCGRVCVCVCVKHNAPSFIISGVTYGLPA